MPQLLFMTITTAIGSLYRTAVASSAIGSE
jgi:hypothetical protein